ncbi:SR-rich pre-mRNA splicing activator [Coniochaeta sp. 2T2.1]|nr:SR-rich pre-mRNA splicing activator [Coniochaeta sp. 2T2.1]
MATGVDARLLKTTKFPAEFNQKVDMTKVNLQVMKKWIAGKVTEILGTEDDVVIELIFNLIENTRNPDIKGLQIQLTGFLDKDTAHFCKELWTLLLSAQTSPQGVPKELLEAKKLELIQEKIEAEKAAEEARLRREEMERRDRGGRGRGGRGGDSWRGGRRDDRDFGRGRGGFGRGGGGGQVPGRGVRHHGGEKHRLCEAGANDREARGGAAVAAGPCHQTECLPPESAGATPPPAADHHPTPAHHPHHPAARGHDPVLAPRAAQSKTVDRAGAVVRQADTAHLAEETFFPVDAHAAGLAD